MIAIQPHPAGATLAVRVLPGAKRNAIVGPQGAALKITVTAPPLDGRANQAVRELLSQWLKIKLSELELLSGETHRNKIILVKSLAAPELAERIHSLLADSLSDG